MVYKRILDEVPLHIREYLLHAFADKDRLPAVVYEAAVKEMERRGTGEAAGAEVRSRQAAFTPGCEGRAPRHG